jgi:hypothetical protein
MQNVLRWGGLILLLLSAAVFWKEYSRFSCRRIGDLRGFLSLLCHLRSKISLALAYGDELWQDFSDENLEACGFLTSVRDGALVSEAFEKCRANLSLSAQAEECLASFFAAFGREYLEAELRRLDRTIEELESLAESESASLSQNKKVIAALLAGAAASAAIILI